MSTKPNLLKNEPIRILTKLGIFNDIQISVISFIDIPNAKNNAKIAPAEDPDISFILANSDSRAFKAPTREKIPMDAGPRIRYSIFLFLFNRTEEIGDVKARRSEQIQPRELPLGVDQFVPNVTHLPNLGVESRVNRG